MTRKLLFINGLAIIGVVAFHAAGMGFVAMFSWAHRYLPASVSVVSQVGSPSYFALRIIEQMVIPCIPAFLFVSGYFISATAGKSHSTVGGKVIVSRIRTLLIPYGIWSTLVIFMRLLEGKEFTPLGILKIFLTGQANEVLYYIPLLIQFYLLAPLIVFWAKRNWIALIIIAAVLQMLVQFSRYPVYGINLGIMVPKWFFITRILWFAMGVVIGTHPKLYDRCIVKLKWWWMAGAVISFAVALVEWEVLYHLSGRLWLPHVETIMDSIYSITLLFALLSLNPVGFSLFSAIGKLGTKSFGIYISHIVFIEYAARSIYHFAQNLLANQLVLQSAFIVIGLGIPLVLMNLTDRLPIRRWYRYLWG